MIGAVAEATDLASCRHHDMHLAEPSPEIARYLLTVVALTDDPTVAWFLLRVAAQMLELLGWSEREWN